MKLAPVVYKYWRTYLCSTVDGWWFTTPSTIYHPSQCNIKWRAESSCEISTREQIYLPVMLIKGLTLITNNILLVFNELDGATASLEETNFFNLIVSKRLDLRCSVVNHQTFQGR